MRLRYLALLFTFLIHACGCPGIAQTFIQGPALIEGFTQTSTAAGTTTLTKDSQTNQFFIGALAQTVVLPSAMTIPNGRAFVIQNKSTDDLTVNMNGGSLLTTVTPDSQVRVTVINVGSAAGMWNVSTSGGLSGILGVEFGGTGLDGSAAANGELLIGNGTGYSLATITGTANQVNVTNGSGSITLSTPQSIATTSSPTFSALTLTNPLTLANGGSSKSLTAVAGGVVWSDADSMEISAAGTSGDLLVSNGTSAPSYQTVSSLLDGDYWKQGGNAFGAAGTIGTTDTQQLGLLTDNVARLVIDADGSFEWNVPAGQNGELQLGSSLSDTNDIRIVRGSSTLTPFDGSPLKVSNSTSEAAARSQYAIEGVINGQNASNTTTRYGGLLGVAFHTSAFNLTATDVGLVGVVGLSRATGSAAAATLTNSAGGSFLVGNDSTNQVMTNAFGVRTGMDSSITNTAGGITNLFGFYMRDQTGGSTFDGTAITNAPAATNRWGIYLNDASNNYLNGSVLIGQKSSTVRTSNVATTSAILDLNSTTGALLVSRMTTTQKNALTPTNGMIVYDTTLSRFECYSTAWFPCGSSDIQNSDLTLTASDTLAISTTAPLQTWLVQGNAAAITMSTTPFGSTDPVSGAEFVVIGNSDTNTVAFPVNDAANGIIGYQVTLGRGQTVTYKYNATLDRYVIKAVSN